MTGARHFHIMLAASLAVAWVTGTDDVQAAGREASSVSSVEQQDSDQARDRLLSALRQSSDLRVRILYSTETMVETGENDEIKRVYLREVIPVAELVEQARGTSDLLVLNLMVRRCGDQSAHCDAADFARRWTAVDTQNQVAWLTLAAALKAKGDLDGARTTFIRAAQASTWHDQFRELARVVVAASPKAASPRMRNAVLVNALSQASAPGIPFGALGTLGANCKDDGDVRIACARIVATMFRDTDTMMGLTLAASYAARADVDPSVVASYRQESDAARWALQHIVAIESGSVDPDTANDETLSKENARLQTMIDLGERRVLDDTLLKQHITKSEAAARLVATLSGWQLEQRGKQSASP